MTFWRDVLANFTGDVFAAALIVGFYVGFQWFLRATDVTVSYSWKWKGTDFHPSFDVRNRSGSRTYLAANVAYTKNLGKDVVFFDNESLWGVELKPGTINILDQVAPVPSVTTPALCQEVEITLRLQNGRRFWLKGQGPGQLHMSRTQRIFFWLRSKVEDAAIPLE